MSGSVEDWQRFLPIAGEAITPGKFARRYAGATVCVAGAGGYIGSAVVRALSAGGVKSLLLLDSSEYALFEIERWMASAHPGVACEAVLGSVGDDALTAEIFARLRPQVVFHAAAFKHVGLLERNILAAIGNNALAGYRFARSALQHGASKFVLVSTDKAANPHSVMGLSKRLAELFVLSLGEPEAIRLGNVIGSPGSVVPLFLEQIEQGRAVSVTDAHASRYFLTRQEAVDAILAAGLADCGGRILLPDFRKPVRIEALARFLTGERGLPIRFCGLKPGEKLSEDLLSAGESQVGVTDGLRVIKCLLLSRPALSSAVENLSAAVAARDVEAVLSTCCSLVPEYVPSVLLQEAATAFSRG